MVRSPSKFTAAAALMLAVLVRMPSTPAGATTNLIAGSCGLTLSADRTGGTLTISTPIAGSCTVATPNPVTMTGTLSATNLTAIENPVNCAGGLHGGSAASFALYSGNTTFVGYSNVDILVESVGGVVVIRLLQSSGGVPILIAAGVFTQSPNVADSCLPVTQYVVTWSGTLVFADPVVP